MEIKDCVLENLSRGGKTPLTLVSTNQIVGELTKGFIYEIRCNITNKCYYGSTTSLYRKYNHTVKSNSTSSKEIIDGGNWSMKTLETIFYKDKSEYF